jgi:hypothetical protein
MTVQIPERLYNLLPATYRRRDADHGEVLHALLAIIDAERERIEADIGTLHDDQFIETCQPWAIAYIADLLDVRLPSTVADTRAYVANAIGYRRRKGVLRTLEELTASITGWPTAAVEFYKHLAVAQHVNHPRPERTGYADVRDEARMLQNGGPFESAPRTAEVRLVDTGRGKYGVSNIGLFVWRGRDYLLEGVRPLELDATQVRATQRDDIHYFQMHPVGEDFALVNPTESKEDHSRYTDQRDVPTALRNRALYRELERRRAAQSDQDASGQGDISSERDLGYFADGQGPFAVRVLDADGETVETLTAEQIYVCDLSDPPGLSDPSDPSDPSGWIVPSFLDPDDPDYELDPQQTRAIVDVELGRMIVISQRPEEFTFVVDYAYGALADLGAGPYDRQASVGRWLESRSAVDFHQGVSRTKSDGDAKVVASLQEALDAWDQHIQGNAGTDEGPVFGIISILDNDTYLPPSGEAQFEVTVAGGHRLAIVAASWPGGPGSGLDHVDGDVVAAGLRPHLGAGFRVERIAGDTSDEQAELVVDGLLIEGSIDVGEDVLGELKLLHTTLVPEEGGVNFEASTQVDEPRREALVKVQVVSSITGPLRFGELTADCTISDSAVVGQPTVAAIGGSRLRLDIARSTVLGQTLVEALEGQDTIFGDRVDVDHRQDGCVRFCYGPSDSDLPRQYRCQPQADVDEDTVRPRFVSRQWWQLGFAQLADSCAPQILTGAEEGAEMGVYNHLHVPQRLANLRMALEEHLRVGMYAGIFFVN